MKSQFKLDDCSDYDSILIRQYIYFNIVFIFCFKIKFLGNKIFIMVGYKGNKNYSFKELKLDNCLKIEYLVY